MAKNLRLLRIKKKIMNIRFFLIMLKIISITALCSLPRNGFVYYITIYIYISFNFKSYLTRSHSSNSCSDNRAGRAWFLRLSCHGQKKQRNTVSYVDYKHRLSKKGTHIIFALKRSQSSVFTFFTLSTIIIIIMIILIVVIII